MNFNKIYTVAFILMPFAFAGDAAVQVINGFQDYGDFSMPHIFRQEQCILKL